MAILFVFFLLWFLNKQCNSNEVVYKKKCFVYDMPDDLYFNGVYQVGDEFK